MQRDCASALIGGVCSGVARYYQIDTLWIRLAFCLGFWFFGAGPLLYLLLWALLPPRR